jgi:hypothetical protein
MTRIRHTVIALMPRERPARPNATCPNCERDCWISPDQRQLLRDYPALPSLCHLCIIERRKAMLATFGTNLMRKQ